MNTITSRSLLTVLSILFIQSISHAQDLDTVTISGRVIDPAGAVIIGAKVTATLPNIAVNRSVVSNDQGRYKLWQLPPGTYILAATAHGFSTTEKGELSLLSGQRAVIDFVLQPQILEVDPITITSINAPNVDTTRTIVGGTLQGSEIQSLPVASRSVLDLIFTLPGVTEEPLSTRDLSEDRNASHANTPEEAGAFALSGGPAYSNNITIDGLDNNDDRSARERFQPSIESVEEVQVVTNQFGAEYGRASGGRINFRTKSGSKDFRGRGFYFFKDESLDANTFRNNTLGLKRLPLQQHNPGLVISGPVLSRTLYLVAYEFETVLDHAVIDTLVPVEKSDQFPLPPPTTLVGRRFEDANEPALNAEVAPFVSVVPRPMRSHKLTARLDHQFSEAHNATTVLNRGQLTNLRQFGGGNRLAEALEAQTRSSDSISYSDNLVFSASRINQLRVQYSQLRPAFKSRTSGPVVLIALNDPLANTDSAQRTGTLVAGAANAGSTERRETRFQMQDTLSLIKGVHSLKVGVDFQRISSTFIDLSDVSGTFSFASAGDFLAARPNRYRQSFLTESTQKNHYFGLFFQDDWRIKDLLISYGVRYERESILDDGNNFAPRVALAYDPFKSGKTVIRVGAGLFYNRALLRTIDDFTLGTQKLFFDTNNLRDPVENRLLSSSQRREFIATNLRFPDRLKPDSTLVQRFAERNTTFTRRLDPALRIPESYQANIGIERDLGGGFVFESNATVNRGIHLWREFNANAPRLPIGYRNFSEYLASRDFANFASGPGNIRPLFNGANPGELVRFVFSPLDSNNPNAVGRATEFGVPISLINLNSISSATAVDVALAALDSLRPDPGSGEVEQLISVGNSFYRGVTVQLQKRPDNNASGMNYSFRVAYTLSHLIDDGIVNTSDALTPGDFRSERARSLLDRRHRFVFSGSFGLPSLLGGFVLSPVWRLASGAPFNISLGGADRNLDDVSNDRPNFRGDLKRLRWRAPGEPLDRALLDLFALPTIGQIGNLPRNAGYGPGLFLLDLSVTREFRLGERARLRPVIELTNVLNKTVFSFGSEFINFNALSPNATPEQRQSLVDGFLLATRTLRQRQIRVGVRFDF